ncbi:MAG: polymer-forming cytoskeletal protein [Elusimicrobia bacterium]|nr:polymer-forming cytoskeletal protein [Elusimicrobiota bacterium]
MTMPFFDKKAEKSDGREGITLIGEEATFHGVLSAKGSLRVDGYVEGDISDAVSVEVGKKGRIKGNIATEVLSISGQVEGDVAASRSVELLAAGRLTGNVKTARLRIEEGAFFNGSCKMAPHEERRGRHGADAEKLAPVEASSR